MEGNRGEPQWLKGHRTMRQKRTAVPIFHSFHNNKTRRRGFYPLASLHLVLCSNPTGADLSRSCHIPNLDRSVPGTLSSCAWVRPWVSFQVVVRAWIVHDTDLHCWLGCLLHALITCRSKVPATRTVSALAGGRLELSIGRPNRPWMVWQGKPPRFCPTLPATSDAATHTQACPYKLPSIVLAHDHRQWFDGEDLVRGADNPISTALEMLPVSQACRAGFLPCRSKPFFFSRLEYKTHTPVRTGSAS